MTAGLMVVHERSSLSDEVELGRRPRRRFGRYPGPFAYYPTALPYPVTFGQSVEEEVTSIEARQECVVLRQGYGPKLLRPVVVDALKGRGWVERAVEAGTLLLCPPPAEATRVRGLGQVRVGGPAVTAVEGVAAGVGVGIVLLGVLLKSLDGIVADVMVAVGSSVAAASIFSAVSRRF